jgi:hypothetical protein
MPQKPTCRNQSLNSQLKRGRVLTVQQGDEVGKMHGANHGKVARIRVFQHALLLVRASCVWVVSERVVLCCGLWYRLTRAGGGFFCGIDRRVRSARHDGWIGL